MTEEVVLHEIKEIEQITLTPQQKQQWEATMSLMVYKAPGFRHIFFKLLTNNNGEYGAVPTKSIPVAATDAKNIMINPDTFFKYGIDERAFIIGHEIMHNVYGDVELLHRCSSSGKVPMNDGSQLPFENSIMQKAMDFRINALLKESRIGSLPTDGCYDPKISGPNDSVLDVYKKLYEDDDGKGKQPGGFDIVLKPGTSTGQNPNTAAQQRNPQQWAVEVAVAKKLEEMRTQGRMPGALSRMFDDILQPKVPWTEHIRSIFNRRVGSGSYDWRRPDRRFIVRDLVMPGRTGHGAGWIVCWGDTSGSISPEELNKYMAELAGIIEECRPRRLSVLWCDAQIHRVDELQDAGDLIDVKYKGAPGGGGTSIHPVMKWIEDGHDEPDMFIAFTDGAFDYPREPKFPVIWASVSKANYPWGEVVYIKD